jgi:signal transduction histidine kinase
MIERQITHQNIFRVLLGGFGLVILLLLAATAVGISNIRSIRENAAHLIFEQSVTNGLIGELQHQQTSLSEVFSILARDPDSVDYNGIVNQLDEADRDINRISAAGASTGERELWAALQRASLAFSAEARRLVNDEYAQTYATIGLFRDHEAFVSVVARLLAVEYGKVAAAQSQIDRRSSRLLETSFLFASAAVVLGLIFAGITVRMVSSLIRRMEWQTAELGRVSWHMLENQEATARRFSHELHDELGQSLSAIKANLASLSTSSAGSRQLEDCLRLVDGAIGNVRQMAQLLRPTILDDFGLEAGLKWLADGFSARTGIEVTVHSGYGGRLPDETETHLFRIAQEALTNIARHSGAKHVDVKLEAVNEEICLSIQDDGRGLPPASPNGSASRPGLGLIGMRARARSAGGDVTVRSRPGQGVLIEVRAPIQHEAHSHSPG